MADCVLTKSCFTESTSWREGGRGRGGEGRGERGERGEGREGGEGRGGEGRGEGRGERKIYCSICLTRLEN